VGDRPADLQRDLARDRVALRTNASTKRVHSTRALGERHVAPARLRRARAREHARDLASEA
jgi:hypothetical protein